MLFAVTKLIPIRKAPGSQDARPAQAESFFVKLAAILAESRSKVILPKWQLGVRTSRGCELAIHFARKQLEEKKYGLLVDIRNAFNEISRESIRDCIMGLRDCDDIKAHFGALYSSA